MLKRTALLTVLFGATALTAVGAMAADNVQVGDQMVFPESVTSTADGTLYAGSLALGAIYKAAPGATKADPWLDKPADGPTAIVGVYADDKTGLLWACYADLAAFSGAGMPSVLKSIDIASATVKGSYVFPGGSFCNDAVTLADGTVYAADTGGSRIMRLKPGATELEEWLKSDALAGVDGISIGGDGKMYVNSVMANKLMRVDVAADGSAGAVTDLTLSEPIMGPDGMRFGDDGKLYLAENAAGRIDEVTIDGDKATIKVLKDGLDGPTAVTKNGSTLWALEAKIGKFGGKDDPGLFYIWPIALQ